MDTKNIKLDESTAKKLYKTASPELKVILEENFTKKALSSDVRDRINTLEDVFAELGTTRLAIVPWGEPKNKKQKSQNAFAIIQAITEAYNEGPETKVLDWTNRTQPKYYLWFEKRAHGGWVFDAVDGYYYCHARMGAGSYFSKRENAEDAYKKFSSVWIDYLPE
jgi:hypothetical protein